MLHNIKFNFSSTLYVRTYIITTILYFAFLVMLYIPDQAVACAALILPSVMNAQAAHITHTLGLPTLLFVM